MAGFAEWQMEPVLAAGLERLGWRADEPDVRDAVPAVLRGGNVVAVIPPAPAWSTPILAGLLGRQPVPDGCLLILAAPSQLDEWAVTVGALIEATALQVDVIRESTGAGGGRGPVESAVVIATPATALARHAGSALRPERFRAILFAWPEQWHADDAVAALLQDVPRDAQRIVLTARSDRLDGTDGVVERYARRALVVAGASADTIGADRRPLSVRTIATPWTARAATTAAVLDGLSPPEATIWTADRRDHQQLQRALASLRPGVSVMTRALPAAGRVICYDLPSARQLAQLSAVGEVILLVPPGAEEYVARIAPSRRPLAVSSAASDVLDRDAVLRRQISEAIDGGDHAAALYALAPLFERFDPQSVAAALFEFWRAHPGAGEPGPQRAPGAPGGQTGRLPSDLTGAPVPVGHSPAVAKIWIGAGKKDEATVADFVAVLVREVGVERSRIGRIELRDTFALVEVPAADAEAIVQRLSGITIRRRKLTARVDQGRARARPPR